MCTTKDFEYKDRKIKIKVTKTAKGKYFGIPKIDGIDLYGENIGKEYDNVSDALDSAEKKAKEIIDQP